jgi:glucose-6-phosphate 1-epimerase
VGLLFNEYSRGIHSIDWCNRAVWLIVQPWGELVVGKLGAQVLHYQPKNQMPVFWLSNTSNETADLKAMRGGVPVCWPWFGAHPDDKHAPNHGIARDVLWSISHKAITAESTTLQFVPLKSLFEGLAVRLELIVSDQCLDISLVTDNLSDKPQRLTQALHSYFYVADYRQVSIEELSGVEYVDKLDDFAVKKQLGVFAVNCAVDYIYKDSGQVTIKDALLKREIVIEKSGSRSTVVWQPADQYKEYGIGSNYAQFICVEAANTEFDKIELAVKETCTLQQRIKVMSL